MISEASYDIAFLIRFTLLLVLSHASSALLLDQIQRLNVLISNERGNKAQ